MSSQLEVLLLGSERQVIDTGNALLGREAFSPSEILQKQQERFNLPDGRLLLVTAAYRRIGLDLLTAPIPLTILSEEHVSHITSPAYHAVIIILGINSDLSLNSSLSAKWMMLHDSLSDLVKRKGVIVVTRGDRFREAQSKGDITVSFIDWIRNYGGISGILQASQERCLLFDNAGSEDVLNKQRHELIHMIDSRVLGRGHYTDMKFKEAELLTKKLEKDLEELKQQVQKKTTSLEKMEIRNSKKTDRCLKDMNNQIDELREKLLQGIVEKIGVMQENVDKNSKQTEQISERLEEKINKLEKVSEEAARYSQELENQVLELKKQALEEKNDDDRKEETKANRDHFERIRDSLLWERMKSLASSYPQLLSSRIRKSLFILILLFLLLLPLLSSLWPVTSNSLKEITALDVRSDLRSYVDLKLEQVVKRIQENEKHLFGLNKTDLNNVSKIRQEMTEQFTELKERLLNETADLTEDIKKNITSRILVLDMIESLPLSLPLIMVLTLLVLLLTPVQLPVPWAWLLAALLILQFLLLLVLLGA
ncbi:hypothetical protein RRG08_052176 [Elysia crispata]|uniref:AIG1-type G domain-containing protein n=1 Tax=Elysia crispata TaxID=231223 RepID=A0AAE0Z1P5_9GAST|nr:hypothetical protein RRG08_052176 [Elysia crispata]